jgi:hypothetical protein
MHHESRLTAGFFLTTPIRPPSIGILPLPRVQAVTYRQPAATIGNPYVNLPINRRPPRPHGHPRPQANTVQARMQRSFACKRLKRAFCFNIAPIAFSRFVSIALPFFESRFLDGFVN